MASKNIIDALYPFSVIDKQLLLTIRDRALEYGTTLEELASAIEHEISSLKKDITPSIRFNRKYVKRNDVKILCPKCKAPLNIIPVNVGKSCTNVGGNWKTSLECSDSKCTFTELSMKTRQELLVK